MRVSIIPLVVAALVAPGATALAQTDEMPASPAASGLSTTAGWDSVWALHFSFTNWFTNAALLGQHLNFGIGASYHLSPDLAVRLGVQYGHTHDPARVTETTVQTADDTVSTFDVTPNNPTSRDNLNVRVDVLHRLMSTAVAPYIGAGIFGTFDSSRQNYVDDVSVEEQVTRVRNRTVTYGIGLNGILGAEWRIHPNFAFYAEYNLSATVVSNTAVNNRTEVETTVGEETTLTRTTEESSAPAWFNINTNLAHGGRLGLAVHF